MRGVSIGSRASTEGRRRVDARETWFEGDRPNGPKTRAHPPSLFPSQIATAPPEPASRPMYVCSVHQDKLTPKSLARRGRVRVKQDNGTNVKGGTRAISTSVQGRVQTEVEVVSRRSGQKAREGA